MIGFFPEIYPDELLYSQLCRYYQRTGYTKYIFAVDDLFMRRTVHPVIEGYKMMEEALLKVVK